MSFCPLCNGPLIMQGRTHGWRLVCEPCEAERRKREWKEHLERIRLEAEEVMKGEENDYYRGADSD